MKSLASIVALLAAVEIVQCKSSRGDSFTIAATGDYLGEVLPSNDKRVNGVWDLIKKADFGFLNMEGNLFNVETFKAYPGSENGKENGYGNVGGGAQYEASQAAAIAKLGFNLASHANNHGFDWLEAGMFATHDNLRGAGIAVAGGGDSLQSAREAAFQKSNTVTVGLVAATGSHLPAFVAGAGDASKSINPRPGLSVLRAIPVTVVPAEQFDVQGTCLEEVLALLISARQDITESRVGHRRRITLVWVTSHIVERRHLRLRT